jgi:NAD+ synthase
MNLFSVEKQGGSMSTSLAFSSDVLRLDPALEVERIEQGIRRIVFDQLRRKGAVLGLSGGIDSSVTSALCAGALGSERVLGLMMPEAESSGESRELALELAAAFGITAIEEDITPLLEASGCYARRDAAIRRVIPEYRAGWKSKIILPDMLNRDRYAVFSIVALSPEGREYRVRLTAEASLELVAATNFKQRARKLQEYYHADRLQYAVAGTPNRLEYDQGFFVKLGDGAADLKPIAHLYKSQVYQLAEYLGIPESIRKRPPTTDTYSLAQSQEEFYFSISLEKMDLCMYGKDNQVPEEEVAAAIGLDAEQVARVYHQIDSRRRVAEYLHCPPLLIES